MPAWIARVLKPAVFQSAAMLTKLLDSQKRGSNRSIVRNHHPARILIRTLAPCTLALLHTIHSSTSSHSCWLSWVGGRPGARRALPREDCSGGVASTRGGVSKELG